MSVTEVARQRSWVRKVVSESSTPLGTVDDVTKVATVADGTALASDDSSDSGESGSGIFAGSMAESEIEVLESAEEGPGRAQVLYMLVRQAVRVKTFTHACPESGATPRSACNVVFDIFLVHSKCNIH
jgi:hypothetical protein